MKFKDIKFRGMSELYGKDAKIGGVDLSNGLSVSIIRHNQSYGGTAGLYEVGVYRGDDGIIPKGWSDTVVGWLKPEDVEREIIFLRNLKPSEWEKE